MKQLLVTSYPNPDLDGFACSLAYAELLTAQGKTAQPYIAKEPSEETRFVMQTGNFSYPINPPSSDVSIILTDTSDLTGLPKEFAPEDVVEIIDHHMTNESEKFLNAKRQIEPVGAAATLIAEKFQQDNRRPSKSVATLLYAAIISNTLNFKATVVTERDRVMAAWLKSKLNLPENFIGEMFRAKSDLSGKKLSATMAGDFVILTFEGITVGISQLEIIEAELLVQNRQTEILEELHALQTSHSLSHVLLSVLDLGADCNIFVTDDPKTQELFEKILSCSFQGNVAKRPGYIMRKQIAPLLKQALAADGGL